MKMHIVLSALLMIGAAGCSTVPAQDQTTVTEAARGDVPATVESSDIATTSNASMSADPMGGAAPVVDEAPAPSSLGASSSGRGH